MKSNSVKTDALLSYLSNKKILILGFGREGQSSLNLILNAIDEIKPLLLGIADKNQIDLASLGFTADRLNGLELQLHTGVGYLDAISNYDIVLKSPGISFKDYTDEWLSPGVLKQWPKTEISGQVDLFLRFCASEKVIGITGTKGKSTTSTLIYQILKNSGRSVHLVGNIGTPILSLWDDYQADDYIVVELSCAQLEFVQASPRFAAITNFYQEHLDHFRSYDEYKEAKLNIIRYQDEDGFFALNTDDEELVCLASSLIQGEHRKTNMADGLVYRGLNPHLMGDHHAVDVALAVAILHKLGLTEDEIVSGIKSFTGIPHRCEYLGTFHGIRFYNDSIATIPEATKSAIDTLKDVDTLIVGGMDRGIDYEAFIHYLAKSDISNIICLPDTGKHIKDALLALGSEQACYVNGLKEAVDLAFLHTKKGHSCLLSPAASSYHKWKNFEARGDEFRHLVKNKDNS